VYCLGRVNSEMEWMWKEMTVARFDLLTLHLSRRASHWIEKKKCIYSTYSPLSSTHTYDFVDLTSLTHPRKILLVVLQIEKASVRIVGMDLEGSDRGLVCGRLRGRLINIWLYREHKLRGRKKIYLLYIFPPELHTLMTSLF
jgi:hypothetical protein